jgi:hypothetical protein
MRDNQLTSDQLSRLLDLAVDVDANTLDELRESGDPLVVAPRTLALIADSAEATSKAMAKSREDPGKIGTTSAAFYLESSPRDVTAMPVVRIVVGVALLGFLAQWLKDILVVGDPTIALLSLPLVAIAIKFIHDGARCFTKERLLLLRDGGLWLRQLGPFRIARRLSVSMAEVELAGGAGVPTLSYFDGGIRWHILSGRPVLLLERARREMALWLSEKG